MKRIVSVLLAVSLLFAMVAVSASAETVNFNDITVDVAPYVYYKRLHTYRQPDPVVKIGNKVLEEGKDYTVTCKNYDEIGTNATLTIIGWGDYQGYMKTIPYAVLKGDISKASVRLYETYDYTGFVGYPYAPEIRVSDDGINNLYAVGSNIHYVAAYENNVNPGTATVRAYGIGNYHGMLKGQYTIGLKEQTVWLQNTRQATVYEERFLTPAKTTFTINESGVQAVYYALYKAEGETAVLIDELEILDCYTYGDDYTYDFSNVYNKQDIGGEIYMLACAWLSNLGETKSYVLTMLVPAKVPPATTMKVEQVPDTGNYSTQYVTYYSEDGALELPEWTISDASVATIDDGTVTFKKPGSVTVTAKCGTLTDSVQLTAPVQDLKKGTAFYYDAKTGKTCVYYDGYLLEEGKDYTQKVSVQDGIPEVTVTGMNFFAGKLVQQFDSEGRPVEHNHRFDNSCDATCNSCDYVRDAGHTYKTRWSRDQENHWHSCVACGDRIHQEAHTFQSQDVCEVCGPLKIVGDLDKNYELDENDAVHLLKHILLPEIFAVDQPVDYDHNDVTDEDDVIYLLQHLLMPEDFPLS